MFQKGAKYTVVLFVLVLLMSMVASTALADEKGADGADRPVTVMTRNVYLGADLTPIFTAILTPGGDVGAAVVQVYTEAMLSYIPGRANLLAGEIMAAQPDLVGLQEVVSWTGPDPGGGGLITIDFLPLILANLPDYEAVVVAEGFDRGFGPIHLKVRDVILARTDQPASELKVSNEQSGQFQTIVSFPYDGSTVDILRQWAAVDVKIRGRSFRFISTHLESADSPPPINLVRPAQAMELLAGPANTDLPVVMVGDFNSLIGESGDAAQIVLDAGFVSVASGNTCCHPDLFSGGSTFIKQIDYIFARGHFRVVSTAVTGEDGFGGIWPSDHGGAVATLLIPDDPD